MGIDREGAHISFHDFLPGLTGVSVRYPPSKATAPQDHFRLVRATDQMLQRFALEELAKLFIDPPESP